MRTYQDILTQPQVGDEIGTVRVTHTHPESGSVFYVDADAPGAGTYRAELHDGTWAQVCGEPEDAAEPTEDPSLGDVIGRVALLRECAETATALRVAPIAVDVRDAAQAFVEAAMWEVLRER